MNQKRFHSGFTLVEISIVMIIIGLLIGGIFGGMKLIDNANVQKTIQDLKAIESAALTFRDTYRALPGDIRSPSTRIPNCTVAPCATAGDGDRILDSSITTNGALTNTSERFTFWSHLATSGLIDLGIKNTTDMNYGEGTPESPIGYGYRLSQGNGTMMGVANEGRISGAFLWTTDDPAAAYAGGFFIPCALLSFIDQKFDDGMPLRGKVFGHYCWSALGPTTGNSTYEFVNPYSSLGVLVYDLQGF